MLNQIKYISIFTLIGIAVCILWYCASAFIPSAWFQNLMMDHFDPLTVISIFACTGVIACKLKK